MRISNGIQNRNRRMRNRTYGGVRGRKTKVGRKLLRFPPTRFLLSWRISLRKCPQSVKQCCTDQGHLLRDGQTRNDRLHQSRMISAGVHALHLNPVHSSFVCPAMPLNSFFASAFRVSKNYAHPKAERQGWFCH